MRKRLSWPYTKSPDNKESGEQKKKSKEKSFCISLLFFLKENHQLMLQLYFDIYFGATKL